MQIRANSKAKLLWMASHDGPTVVRSVTEITFHVFFHSFIQSFNVIRDGPAIQRSYKKETKNVDTNKC